MSEDHRRPVVKSTRMAQLPTGGVTASCRVHYPEGQYLAAMDLLYDAYWDAREQLKRLHREGL